MPKAWKTVRVFISSTFRDMHAERDHLVRFVFPHLREELLKRRIHLVDVDLRWGVTSEQDALEVCREIIDECRPRFICILGGRYGWTPQGKEQSITAAEIQYAVLDRLHAKEYRYFYFRDPQVTASIPESAARAGGYRESASPEEIERHGKEQAEALARRRTEKLEATKQAIVDAGFEPFVYPARWDDAQQRLVDLETFGARVYADLLWSINDEFGTQPPEALDEFTEENAAMEAFVEERVERYIVGSRQTLLDEMTAFAEADGKPSILVLTGKAGLGKSALLGKFYQDYVQKHPDEIAIPHFVGASAGSTDLRRTLRRFCHELGKVSGSQEEIPQDVKELVKQFAALLKQVAGSRRVVLLIDALNQFDATDNAHSMYWLPDDLPPGVRVIVSSLDHPGLEALHRRRERIREIALQTLTQDDGRAIVEGYLQRYHKRMTQEQVEALLEKPESGSPLYLLVALEELRTLGTYEEISDRIRALPGQVRLMFLWILKERLSNDPGFRDSDGRLIGAELVRKFVSCLGVSRHGLSHAELVDLIAPGDPLGNVAALQRLLRPYLMCRGELMDFYHTQLREAVETEYLDEEQERLEAHRALAQYFRRKADPTGDATWKGDYRRGLSEVPYHLLSAEEWQSLVEVLTDYEFVETKVEAGMTFELVRDHNITRNAIPPGSLTGDQEARLRDWRNFVSGCSHKLAGGHEPFLQVAYNYAASGSVATAAEGRALHYQGAWICLFNRPHLMQGPTCVLTLEGHTNDVYAVAVTPDGRWAVSGSWDGTLRVWDLENGQCLWILEGEKVDALAVTPDGRRVVSGGSDPTLRVWDLESGTCLQTLEGHREAVLAVAVTGDGRRAVSGSWHGTLRVWDLKSGACLCTLKAHRGPVRVVAVTPDGQRAVSWSGEGLLPFFGDYTVRVWDLESGECLHVLKGPRHSVNVVAVTPDGRRAVSGSRDGTLRAWDLESGECLQTLKGHRRSILAVAMTPDGRQAVSGASDRTLRVWDLESGKCLRTLEGHAHIVWAVAVTPDARWVVSGSRDDTLRVWDLQGEESQQTFGGHTDAVLAMSCTPDGRSAISSGYDKTLRVWDLKSGECLRTLKGHRDSIEAVAVTPDGRQVVSSSGGLLPALAGRTLRMWDLESGECLRALRGHRGRVKAVAVTPDGRQAVSGNQSPVPLFSAGTLRVWDLGRGKCLRTLKGHTGSVNDVVATPDGRKAISGSSDRTLRVWDLESGKCLRVLKGHRDSVNVVAVTPDGRLALSAGYNPLLMDFGDTALRVWDVETQECLHTLKGHRWFVAAVAVMPDGRHAVSGGADKMLRVWDLETGKEIACWSAEYNITTCAVGPEGKRIVVGVGGGRVYFLALQNVVLGPLFITAWRSPLDSIHAFGCPHCRTWSEIPAYAIGTELPCPNCGKLVKLNPFTINADWRPIAEAWRGGRD